MTGQFICPQCGQKFEIQTVTHQAPVGFQPKKWQEFGFTIGPGETPSLAAGMSYTRRESARVPVKEDIIVPVAWSAITGIAVASMVTAFKVWLGWSWHWPLVACFASTSITWILLLVDWRAMLWRVETITGMDVDKDGSKGKPEEKPNSHVVEFTDHSKKKKAWIEMPVDEKMMLKIAKAYGSGRFEFSRRDMMAATRISDDKFEKLQKLFLERAWAVYRKEGAPNSGVELTAAGKHVLRSYLPSPQSG